MLHDAEDGPVPAGGVQRLLDGDVANVLHEPIVRLDERANQDVLHVHALIMQRERSERTLSAGRGR